MPLVTVNLSSPVVAAINCGGPAFAAADGTVYQADALFAGGSIFSTTAAIAGTTDDVLYQSLRYGSSLSYDIPVAAGDYLVTLQFAETFFTQPGQRVFDVRLEGVERISNLDLVGLVGPNTAHNVTLPVSVSDGSLEIDFLADVDNAVVNAIRVVAVSGPDPALWTDQLTPAWMDGTRWADD